MWATCRSERNWCWACARSILGEHELNGWLRLANITPLEYGANPKRPRQRVRPWQMNQLRWFTEWKAAGGRRGRGTCVVGVCVCERGASGSTAPARRRRRRCRRRRRRARSRCTCTICRPTSA